MGGKKWQRKSSTSAFLSMFNNMVTKTSNRIMRTPFAGYDTKEDMCEGWDEAVDVRTVRPSDDDRGRWVAEPDIDRKASAFIAKFYESRVSDAERKTVSPV